MDIKPVFFEDIMLEILEFVPMPEERRASIEERLATLVTTKKGDGRRAGWSETRRKLFKKKMKDRWENDYVPPIFKVEYRDSMPFFLHGFAELAKEIRRTEGYTRTIWATKRDKRFGTLSILDLNSVPGTVSLYQKGHFKKETDPVPPVEELQKKAESAPKKARKGAKK